MFTRLIVAPFCKHLWMVHNRGLGDGRGPMVPAVPEVALVYRQADNHQHFLWCLACIAGTNKILLVASVAILIAV